MFKMIRNKVQDMFETHIEELVRKDHPYRKLLAAIDFKKLCKPLQSLFHETLGRKGYNIESGFAALVLQWMEDLSDRELERFLQENTAGKLFCGFSLLEKTPDHSYFSLLRDKIAQNTMKINGCENRAILKNNMKKKDFERDAKISKKRMPFERVFSKQSKKARYRGIAKNQFQGFMQALVFNFKRLISLQDVLVLQS